MVVIAIMSVMAVLTFQVAFDTTTEEAVVSACAQKIKSDIRYLNSQASSTQLAHRIVFDPGTDSYSTYTESGGAWSALESNVDFGGCDIQSSTLDSHTLIFNYQGFAYEGTDNPMPTPTNPVETNKTLILKATPSSSAQRTLTIYSGTGLIE